MTKEEAIKLIWDYMKMGQELRPADVIIVLGNRDSRTAEWASRLWLQGLAPYLICSGSGDIHNHMPGREQFVGSTEAEVFANIAIKMGVPEEKIIIENTSQNTEDNFTFSRKLLEDRGINLKTAIVVQKPFTERRAYATGKNFWPDVEIIVTSPPLSIEKYPDKVMSIEERWIHTLVGDLQRIREYPKLGFQIEQEIPDEVWSAFEFLVEAGYNQRLIKN